MLKKNSWTHKEALFALAAFSFVLFLHGAVPFLMVPTLGQAVWSMGFSQSFANGPLFDFYVHDFGIPNPAAMAFGLAGAWPASLLIRLGMHASDAFASTAALWLGLAMFSAYRISRRFTASRSVALVGAIAWLCMPTIWAHAGYSMLSWGIALLSFYFFATFRLFLICSDEKQISQLSIAIYFLAAVISVFMDGYTFMMFAAGASILFLYSFVTRPEIRPSLLRISLPVHALSFALAYFLFRTYIGKSNFESHSLEFFRGWGLDLSFFAVPTKGVLWLSDLLGISLKRTDELYFGDRSVWTTTFGLPALIFGLVGWWRIKGDVKIATGILLFVIFGFYMALGPSLKINSIKQESLQLSHPRQESAPMPADLAIAPTGNAWISKILPGFSAMRASYRWSALGIFGLWLLIMASVPQADKRKQRIWLSTLCILILFNLPNFQETWREKIDSRDMFAQIDKDLVPSLQRYIQKNETVAFIPWRNDFIANYLGPRAGFRTYNIGGDKNLLAAQVGWPPEMIAQGGEIDPAKAKIAVKMLIGGAADVLVIPYFHMLWSPHLWFCPDQTTAKLTAEYLESFRSIPGFICPKERKAELRSVVAALRDLPYLNVSEVELFATVRLRREFSGVANRATLLRNIFKTIEYPIALGQTFENSSYVLREGWHGLESHQVWSQSTAKLTLPVPKNCEDKNCEVKLIFGVFGASPHRPVSIHFNSAEQGWDFSEKIVAHSGDVTELTVPLTGAMGSRNLNISVPNAIAPKHLSDSHDNRVLGISLQRIELLKP